MLSKRKVIIGASLLLLYVSFISSGYGAESLNYGDESDIFRLSAGSGVDALIVLDLTGSMADIAAFRWADSFYARLPPYPNNKCSTYNGPFYIGYSADHPDQCRGWDSASDAFYSDSSCSRTSAYYKSSGPGHDTDCRKIEIAKKSIRSVLDVNGDSQYDKTNDDDVLGIRFGLSKFHYNPSYIKVLQPLGSSYKSIADAVNDINRIINNVDYRTGGETPLGDALAGGSIPSALTVLNNDPGGACQKFVILISDGADNASDIYGGTKGTVAAAYALARAKYKVFVIGFGADGDSSYYYTLNWAAKYGGTDNPFQPNEQGNCSVTIGSRGGPVQDPGQCKLTGYAYNAYGLMDLTAAIKSAVDYILEARYSFTVPSVASARIFEDDYLIEASFSPVSSDPFWRGNLRKYPMMIDSEGIAGFGEPMDAGQKLKRKAASSRKIYTAKSGAMIEFTASNISKEDLGVSSDDAQKEVIGYIRGEIKPPDPATYNPEDWKLGDIFHSSPKTIRRPNVFFTDSLDSQDGFSQHRDYYPRADSTGGRIVIAGANDGQLHAFRTNDMEEIWSFIPPNLLTKLQYLTHNSHPVTGKPHLFFVDGPITAAEVWWGEKHTEKKRAEWRTLAIVGEGRGARKVPGTGETYSAVPAYLWSSSSECLSGFREKYEVGYGNYCGYYFFDLTATTSIPPSKPWRLNFHPALESSQAPYLGEPWSKVAVGRVKIEAKEKWVGFMGGGYNAQRCTGNPCEDTRGKGFFVSDLQTGQVRWSYTLADNSKMRHAIPASPAVVDLDRDEFIDTAYLGDMDGNLWRFKFCGRTGDEACGPDRGDKWTGGLFFDASGESEKRPIFATPAVALGDHAQLWVFWGTGDSTAPTNSSGPADRFFGVKEDILRAGNYTIGNLENINVAGNKNKTFSDSTAGWYIDLARGEMMLSDPLVYGGVVFFTTYTHSEATGNVCAPTGTARLYAMAMKVLTVDGVTYDIGAGVLTRPAGNRDSSGGARSMIIGTGIPSAPIISTSPEKKTANLIVTISGAGGQDSQTKTDRQISSNLQSFLGRGPSGRLIHWRDRRLQP